MENLNEEMNCKLLGEARAKIRSRWSQEKVVRFVHQYANNEAEAKAVLTKLFKA